MGCPCSKPKNDLYKESKNYNKLKHFPIVLNKPKNNPINKIYDNNCGICTNNNNKYICRNCRNDLYEIVDSLICIICNKFASIEGKSYCISCTYCASCKNIKENDRLINKLCSKCDFKCLNCNMNICCIFNDYCNNCIQNYGIYTTLNIHTIEKICGYKIKNNIICSNTYKILLNYLTNRFNAYNISKNDTNKEKLANFLVLLFNETNLMRILQNTTNPTKERVIRNMISDHAFKEYFHKLAKYITLCEYKKIIMLLCLEKYSSKFNKLNRKIYNKLVINNIIKYYRFVYSNINFI
jgi:hypothetical protein